MCIGDTRVHPHGAEDVRHCGRDVIHLNTCKTNGEAACETICRTSYACCYLPWLERLYHHRSCVTIELNMSHEFELWERKSTPKGHVSAPSARIFTALCATTMGPPKPDAKHIYTHKNEWSWGLIQIVHEDNFRRAHIIREAELQHVAASLHNFVKLRGGGV